jgi:hypothetical protein
MTLSRVVCARGVTMLNFSPIIAFINDDLPTLGRPTNATNPAFGFTSSISARIYGLPGAGARSPSFRSVTQFRQRLDA